MWGEVLVRLSTLFQNCIFHIWMGFLLNEFSFSCYFTCSFQFHRKKHFSLLEITFLVLFQVRFVNRWKWTLIAFEVISVNILSFSTCNFQRRRWSDVVIFWGLVSWTYWKFHYLWKMSFWIFMLNQSQLVFEWTIANITFEWSDFWVSCLFVNSNTGHVRSNQLKTFVDFFAKKIEFEPSLWSCKHWR